MKTSKHGWLAVGCAAVMVLSAVSTIAQEGRGRGRGDFNPEEFRERMMDRVREQLEVKDDAEWKIISARVERVMEARREAGPNLGGGGFGFRGRGGPGGPGGPRGDRGDRGPRGDREGDPAMEALRDAIDNNASSDDIKAKLAKARASRKAKQKELEAAQAELRKVLSIKQEATAYMMGLVP